MSHGTYLFVLDDDEVLRKEVVPAHYLDEIYNSRYSSAYCDENNWHDLLFLTRPGRPTLEYGNDRVAEDFNHERALELAWGIALNDLRIFGESNFGLSMSREKQEAIEKVESRGGKYIDKYIRTEIPKIISASFQPGEKRTALIKDRDESSKRWVRSQIVKAYEHYGSSVVPPFACDLCSPYEWRVFDLREWSEERERGLGTSPILGVDIHT